MTKAKIIIGLGSLLSGLGKKFGGKFGAGMFGFGLAHIFLGFLYKIDMPWK